MNHTKQSNEISDCTGLGGRWRYAVSALLATMIVLFAAACDREPVVENDLNFVTSDGYSIYTIVYSEETATEEVVQTAHRLRDAMETILNCEVALTDDHVQQGSDYTYEILIGDVARTVVPGVLSVLEHDEYTVRVAGHKILLLGADNRATVEAVRDFMRDVLHCESVDVATANPALTIAKDYCQNSVHTAPQTPVSAETVLPVATYLPEELLLVDLPERDCDALTLATLQGLAATLSGEQIFLNVSDHQVYRDRLVDTYGATVYETNAAGKKWTTATLLKHYAPKLKGYILCADDPASESAAVAVSMAHQLSAVVVSAQNRALAEQAGLPCVFDATSATMTWFFGSEYFAKINRTVAVEQSLQTSCGLVDYAVMSGALLITYDGEDSYLHAQMFRYLDDGAVVLGMNEQLGEYDSLITLSTVQVCCLFADQAYNLSTLSGFVRDGVLLSSAANETDEMTSYTAKEETVTEEGKHTVCLLMSEGENLSWVMDDFLTSDSWYGSSRRGSVNLNWGIPALLGELNHPVLSYLAENQTESDSFVIQLSGIGTTFPSLWHAEAVENMAQQLSSLMQKSAVFYLQVTDEGAADPTSLAPLAEQESVRGIFYTDYHADVMDGTISWVEDTPIVTARYRLTADEAGGSLDLVAESINSAATDPTSVNSYSVVVIDAKSGLSADGQLVIGGNTMDAVAALVAGLDENVEVVSAAEFMNRIKKNLMP